MVWLLIPWLNKAPLSFSKNWVITIDTVWRPVIKSHVPFFYLRSLKTSESEMCQILKCKSAWGDWDFSCSAWDLLLWLDQAREGRTFEMLLIWWTDGRMEGRNKCTTLFVKRQLVFTLTISKKLLLPTCWLGLITCVIVSTYGGCFLFFPAST